jgi:hypothetical protein
MAISTEQMALSKFRLDSSRIGHLGNVELFDAGVSMMGFQSSQALIVPAYLALAA